ncbi:hypothetical protein Poly24_37970 [Rosistilla carotiformis]|uniref:Uncharacterized protein n=1 Tax=Rosistilla carotiformis TaxID=2528017 RepID=A0A518JX13_9BACT|nr:hypothetical protein [Rosistilla carotiformis]QDV70078.1 hypothetical protein Poly24_37970 [Rosistilla carotiformis]
MVSLLNHGIGIARRTIIVGLLAVVAAAPSVYAVAPQVDQGQAGVNKEPVVVLALASLDGLLRDVNHLSTISGMPQAGAMLNIYVGAYSQGIDRSKPLGVIVRMIDGVPSPMLFVAISDVKAVLKRLEPQFGPADSLDDGTMVMQAGPNLIYIRNQGDWAYVANDRGALNDLPEDPQSLLQDMHLDHDIGIRANLQQIPEPMRMGLVAQMRQAFDDAVKRMQERGEGNVQAAPPNEAVIKQMELMMRDSEYITIGVTIDAENNEIAVDASGTAIEGSSLAEMYNDRQSIPTSFAGMIRPDATAFTHAAATTGEREQEVSLESIDQSMKQLRAVIGQYVELSDSDSAKIEQYLPRVKELLAANVEMGKINGGVVATTQENELRVLFGGAVTNGKKVEELAKEILGEFAGNADAPQFKFNDGSYAGLTLHHGHVDLPAGNKELNKMFGSKLPLLIATSEDRIYIGAGKDIDALLKETVDASTSGTPAEALPLSQGTLSLLPALQYAYWVSENSITDMLLKTLQNNPEHDKVRFVQPVEPNGQRVRFSVDDGVLQVIGVAAQAGKGRPEF